jgi:hypothetical protein
MTFNVIYDYNITMQYDTCVNVYLPVNDSNKKVQYAPTETQQRSATRNYGKLVGDCSIGAIHPVTLGSNLPLSIIPIMTSKSQNLLTD